VILKSYIVEQNIEILSKYQSVLLYGENEGIKEDIKNKLKIFNQDAEIIIFFENDIIKDSNILNKNIINESLFNEKKIIIIQSASDKIYKDISYNLELNNKNIKIYIFCENLDKKSKLRSLFEKNKNLAIFACYEDNDKTLIDFISRELNDYRGLTGELINLIISNSNSNRKIIQSEIIKIKNFFIEKKIKKEQLIEILNIKNDAPFERIRDNALTGQKKNLNKLLSEIDILNEDSFSYLGILNYRVLRLKEILTTNELYQNHEKTLENIKPQIFWKDKPIYLQQLKKWNLQKITKIANKIGETEILMKKKSQIRKDLIIKDLIISISKSASISF
tara:strand:+ start:4473 stop:5477 length:1005 start_codon:yes stop_codon:yes gene_type:complete